MDLFLKKQEKPKNLSTPINPQQLYDVVVVGGGPAGLSAALYALRKELSVALISDNLGGQILYTSHIENYPGFLNIGGYDLTQKIQEQIVQYPLALAEGLKVVAIQKEENFTLTLSDNMLLKSKTLILATGQKWRPLGVSKEEEFIGKGLSYCTTCDAPLFKNKNTAVVGGGNSALGSALELSKIANKVYLIVRRNILRADPVLISKVKETPNIEILLEHHVKELKGTPLLKSVLVEHAHLKETQDLNIEGLFVEIGLIPSVDFNLTPALTLNDKNEIIIDNQNNTNILGLFAAGDVTNISVKQIVVAAAEGAKAALSAFSYLQNQN